MRTLKKQVLLRIINSYIVDSPQPANISYLWNFGSLLGTCLVLQILTGIFLAMHYQPHVDFAFNSVEHIMRDVNNGWAVRYTHANVASFFFIFVYAHIARGLYYGSYKSPRILVWTIGVIIFILMMATAFLGYVLPYGQMSLWGYPLLALNAYLLNFNFILSNCTECLDTIFQSSDSYLFIFNISLCNSSTYYINNFKLPSPSTPLLHRASIAKARGMESHISKNIDLNNYNNSLPRIKADLRIGPHNKEILSIIFGGLLGDAYAELRNKGNGTRISFYQEGIHLSYLLWLHNLVSELGYCNVNIPKITTRLGSKGRVRQILRFKT